MLIESAQCTPSMQASTLYAHQGVIKLLCTCQAVTECKAAWKTSAGNLCSIQHVQRCCQRSQA